MTQKGSIKVTFERGLNEYTEPSRLEMGFSTVLKNWVPEPDGSLRQRVGWKKLANGMSPATKKVRGIGYNPKHDHMGDPAPAVLIANAEQVGGNPGYTFYHAMWDALDDPLESWTSLESVGGASWDNDRFVPMTMAGGRLLYCTEDMSLIRAWNGVAGTVATIGNSRTGRTMCYYKNRVFTGGGAETVDPADIPENVNTFSTQPWRLWFSGLVPANITGTGHWDTTDLDNPAGFIEVGKDDGQNIEFIVPFDQGILIGKTDSLYYLVGTSPATFQLIPLDAGETAPGRSIVVSPYGAVILGRSEAFIFKGNIPEPIDTPVADSYGMTGEYLSGAYIDGAVHIVDANRDLSCVYDLENDTWRTEVVGVAPGVNFSYQGRMITCPWNSNMTEMGFYRDIPDGERGKDQGYALSTQATTPEMWLGGVTSPATVRHCYVRYRVRRSSTGTQDTAQPLVVKLYKNGTLHVTQNIVVPSAEGVYRERLDLKGTMYSTKFDFSFTGLATDRQSVDIEEVELFVETEPAR